MMDERKIEERMMRVCSLGEHCRSDIVRKLAKYPEISVDKIIDKLVKEGYIDDCRYAGAFARDKSSLQGWGSSKIRVALQAKGIQGEVIEAAISGIDREKADAVLEKLLATKWKALSKEANITVRQAKLFRFALGRGYSYQEIKRSYDNIRTDKRD